MLQVIKGRNTQLTTKAELNCQSRISPAAHSVPIRILLGSAVPKPCFTQTLPRRHHTKIGSKQQRRVRPKTGRTRLQLRLKIQYLQSPECVWAAGAICACPPCLPKSATGGGSQWREAFILTIDGWRLLRYGPFQSASHRTISAAAAKSTLSAVPFPWY